MDDSAGLPSSFARVVAELRATRPREELTLSEIEAPRRLAPYAYALRASVNGADGNDESERDPNDLTEVTGRLIVLYDPAGQENWEGYLRLVTYITAELEPEIVADPMFAEVSWGWLTEALATEGANYTAAAGTVTQIVSSRFGELAVPKSERSGELAAEQEHGRGPAAKHERNGSTTPTHEHSTVAPLPGHSSHVLRPDMESETPEPSRTTDVELRASWTPLDEDLVPHLAAWCSLLASTAGLPPSGGNALMRRPRLAGRP